jgi:hypothetical protein
MNVERGRADHSKPKNARVKRALEKREPQVVENEKSAIFVRGQNTSENVRAAMKDLVRTLPPYAIHLRFLYYPLIIWVESPRHFNLRSKSKRKLDCLVSLFQL